ncbi:epoxyqueuosine reductase [Desulfopila sp. IMCC35008]|uniref:epoxyqueuosine reductase n=1 Tax=Desulfopila sp. IMCC35008 TaxID=2653858 RepID=UPI00197B0356|nr:epoxyqueuosine reductase [Desulfopila sp. IMCC35008]
MENMNDITEKIIAWAARLENNRLGPDSDLFAFGEPLVGFAAGNDPLFAFLQEDIGPDFYWTPEIAYRIAFPLEELSADDLSVITWVLPQTENTRMAHGRMHEMPSIEWSKARHYGEQVNMNLRRYVVEMMAIDGYHACSPMLMPEWSRETSARYGYASSWSERHTAYVCGLGTFGLSDGLITRAGKAIRVGSAVVRRKLSPSPREYTHHMAWCMRFAGRECMACIRRCPIGAISECGHDKVRCKEYIRNVTAEYVEQHQLGFTVNSCGLCQTRVPCEEGIPFARGRKRR